MATVFIQDITQLSKEAWREERKKGIGGSDVGAIMGLNEFKSPFDVYYDKVGAKNQKPLSDKARVTMEEWKNTLFIYVTDYKPVE